MRTTIPTLGLGIILALLASCATLTPEEQARQARLAEERREAYTTALSGTCFNYGFVRGTPAFAQCMMQLDQAETQRREQRAIAIMNHFRPRREQGERVSIPTPATTTCQRWGNTVHCQTQ